MKDSLNIKEVAKILQVHQDAVNGYIENKELKSYKNGKTIKVNKTDLDSFIKNSQNIDKKIEIELRYKIKNLTEIKAKLKSLGAKLTKESHIIDHWFIPNHLRNMKEEIEWFDVKRNTAIRIRENIDKKGKCFETKIDTKRMTLDMNHNTFLETSMNVESLDKAKEFIQTLDRKEYLTIDKQRLVYIYKDFNISIDDIKDFASGIEIEYIGPNSTREKVLKEIKEFALKLGLKDKMQFEKSLTVDAMDTLSKF